MIKKDGGFGAECGKHRQNSHGGEGNAAQKTVLAKGSTDGIGLKTVKMLVPLGHHVLLHGRNPSKLEAAEKCSSRCRVVGALKATWLICRTWPIRNDALEISSGLWEKGLSSQKYAWNGL